jgi:putative addiction module component (TIGR02574 family)
MMDKLSLPPPGFDELTVEDQIDYIQLLWDRIAANPGQVPVPEWHRQVLNERLAADQTDRAARPWEEVRDEIRLRLERGSKP